MLYFVFCQHRINLNHKSVNEVTELFWVYYLKRKERVWHLRRSSHLWCSHQTEYQQVHNKAIILDDERGKLQPSNYTIWVCVIHILQENRQKYYSNIVWIYMLRFVLDRNNLLVFWFFFYFRRYRPAHGSVQYDSSSGSSQEPHANCPGPDQTAC